MSPVKPKPEEPPEPEQKAPAPEPEETGISELKNPFPKK
jgi:hypothetical protein